MPGFRVIKDRQPPFLLDGALLVIGDVPRGTPAFRPGTRAWRAGRRQHDPLVHDDQTLAAPWRGAGWYVTGRC